KTGRNRPWKSKPDFHFPTAATTTNLRLHFKCPDYTTYGYILKRLDAEVYAVSKAAGPKGQDEVFPRILRSNRKVQKGVLGNPEGEY
ncbi:MAG TPA: hypothetical protein VKQ28_11470, partial [Candidatus Acidoferrum sp.]|nr:hypothetical protein [Candidatus Acidoferrum sp.]